MPERRKIFKKYKFILAALVFALPGEPAEAQSTWITNDTAVHNLVWEQKLYNEIGFLADSLCEGRATGTRGGTEAAFWLIRKYRETGLIPFGGTYAKHIYAGRGLVGHNIIGMIPGSKKYPSDKYVVVAAHYDHIGKLGGTLYPGADCNASGVVAMTTLAEMFSSMKVLGRTYGCNIIFAAFDAKEMSMAGSYAFWKSIEDGELADPATGITITPEQIVLMVNIDQIGCSMSPLASGRKDYIIALGNDSLDRSSRGILSMCNRFYDTNLELSYTYYGSETFTKIFYMLSDQKVFVENKVPAVFFTSGITMNTNKTYDTAETIDLEVLRRRIILIYHWLEKML